MTNNHNGVITVPMREASLKKRLRRHLKSLGFQKDPDGFLVPPGTGKEAVRTIHAAQREDRLEASEAFISARFSKLIGYFASGDEVDPKCIKPSLQRIASDTWEGDLFSRSGFYTNRLRLGEVVSVFKAAGFSVEVRNPTRWSALPTPRSAMDPSFSAIPETDMLVSDAHLVMQPR